MPTLRIIAVGRMKADPALQSAYEDYIKRIKGWRVELKEIDIRETGARQNILENEAILKALLPDSPLIALDARGKLIDSPAFSSTLQKFFDQGNDTVQFAIGGSDGLNEPVLNRSNLALSFGALTWPHRLARVMLAEQIYRARQIALGHPYHH